MFGKFTHKTRHSLNSLVFRTAWVSLHQKGETVLDFYEAKHDGVALASAEP